LFKFVRRSTSCFELFQTDDVRPCPRIGNINKMLATRGFAGHSQPMSDQNSQRLDQLLVTLGLFASRSRARDAVSRGTVKVAGKVVTKAGAIFGPDAAIEIDDPAQDYVSRAALKLVAALDHFGLDPAGRHCLDVGASTGGFTEVLLERGAVHVTAIDVGHGQMHPRISTDTRVTNIEGLNARNLTAEDIDHAVDFVVSDVSFISLKLALAPALDIAETNAIAAILVKPQFEAGREAIGKGGLLKDPASGPDVAAELERWFTEDMGWKSLGLIPSPISGGDGNQEFLLAGTKA
jgi:23S rRNA (cytidine1920-2'-O)/16S rRNA (cytidine1409-2'-O)-methyltransferase